MIMKLNINDRAALAIKNNTKRVEIRANKENSEHDYGKLKQNDIIEFTSNNLGVFYVKVKEVNHYNSLEELPPHSLLEIKNFFENYKLLQHIEVKVFDYHGTNEAMQIIEDGKRRFKEKNGR